MKVKSLLFVGVSFLAFPYQTMAQFYTIMRESESAKRVVKNDESGKNKVDEDYFYAYQDSMRVHSKESETKTDFGDFFSTADSKKGYGNHVVLDYGHIQCLYGHLAAVTVREGDEVYAGTIVGISGNTGKSTGPHLHIKITANGKSLNPTPFIAYLNKYITGLRDKIAYVRFGTRPPKELNINNLYQALDKYGIAFPKIVVAQALLETGYFTSNVCLNYNNLFGLRRPSDGSYYRFGNWEESVKAYKDYVQYKYRGGDYFRFLGQIGYAEDPNYLYKVKSISSSL